MVRSNHVVAAVALCLVGTTSQGQLIEKKGLTIDAAKQLIAAAVTGARESNAPGGVIAVVDDGVPGVRPEDE